MPRHVPSRRQTRALEFGADELVARLEWELRDNPKQLKKIRGAYAAFCLSMLTAMERRRR